tara:strand:- start:5594 stop:5776 length:183 start_codon:yes stop_codon:yes gene_type:complete
MEDDFTVVTTQDIIELRDLITGYKDGHHRSRVDIQRDANALLNKTHTLLGDMIESTRRHS